MDSALRGSQLRLGVLVLTARGLKINLDLILYGWLSPQPGRPGTSQVSPCVSLDDCRLDDCVTSRPSMSNRRFRRDRHRQHSHCGQCGMEGSVLGCRIVADSTTSSLPRLALGAGGARTVTA